MKTHGKSSGLETTAELHPQAVYKGMCAKGRPLVPPVTVSAVVSYHGFRQRYTIEVDVWSLCGASEMRLNGGGCSTMTVSTHILATGVGLNHGLAVWLLAVQSETQKKMGEKILVR